MQRSLIFRGELSLAEVVLLGSYLDFASSYICPFRGNEKLFFCFFFWSPQPSDRPNSSRSLLFAKTHLFTFYSAESCQRKPARWCNMGRRGRGGSGREGGLPLWPPPTLHPSQQLLLLGRADGFQLVCFYPVCSSVSDPHPQISSALDHCVLIAGWQHIEGRRWGGGRLAGQSGVRRG